MKLLLTTILAFLYSTTVAQTVESLKFGPQNEQSGNAIDAIIAVVGNDVITRSEIDAYSNSSTDKNDILNTLILRKILLQEAARFNIRVNDTTINLAMEDFLKQNNRSINSLSAEESSQMREQIREDLTIARLKQNVLRRNIKISEKEIDSLMEREFKSIGGSVRLMDVLIPIDNEGSSVLSSQLQLEVRTIHDLLKNGKETEVRKSYPKAQFNDLGWVELNKIPLRFTQGLVDIQAGEYAKPITDSDGVHILKVIERKSNLEDSQVNVTETKAQHILIRAEGENDTDAKNRIESIARQIENGIDFDEAAITYSQDYGSAAKGGDLGWVLPGQMVPDFEAAMNKLAINEISQPVKSSFGWHLIRVTERRQSDTSNQDTLRQQVYQKLFSQRSDETWNLWMREVRDQTHIEIR